MIKRILLLCAIWSLPVAHSFAQLSLVSFSTGFSAPVDIKNCGDNRLFVVEQAGRIQICDTGGVHNTTPFLNITNRVRYSGEQGLLGLAFPPEFLSNGYFYVDYVANSDGHTHISRFKVDSLNPDVADAASEEILLSIFQPFSNHKGGNLSFGQDGYLYIGMGDGGSFGDPLNRAQNPDSLLGKMLRISVTGGVAGYSIPPQNPFASDTSQGRPEVFDMGMRNPFRWSFDRLTGDLFIGDVGQDLIEEVDIQREGSPGLNYGWHCYEANAPYNTTGCQPANFYTAPVFQYNHSPGGYCSVIGGYIYRGSLHQELYGKYFFTDYCVAEIRFLERDSTNAWAQTNIGVLNNVAGIVCFGEDVHGEIYAASQSSNIVYRLTSADCTPVATVNNGNDTVVDCGSQSVNLSVPMNNSFGYVWTFNGDTVSTTNTYIATQAGRYIVHVTNQACSNTDSVYVNFTAPLNLNFTGLDTLYCSYGAPANLSPNFLGGTFSGTGLSNATFSPADAGLGTFTITYNYTANNGCAYSYSQDVRVDACLNVDDNSTLKNIELYPNPSSDNFNMTVYSSKENILNWEVMDITGRIMKTGNMILSRGENKFNLQHQLSAGVYILNVEEGNARKAIRFVVN